MFNFVLRLFSWLVDASLADALCAHFATLQEKLVIPDRYPSFAHITILSLDDLREFAHLVAMTCLGLGPYTTAYKMLLTGWTCAPLFIRIKATRPSPENRGGQRETFVVSILTSSRASCNRFTSADDDREGFTISSGVEFIRAYSKLGYFLVDRL